MSLRAIALVRRHLWAAAFLSLALAGVALRAFVLTGPAGSYDSDEAVVGLMAQQMLEGEWRAFYWGQHYAGTLETALVALAGAQPATTKLVPVALWALAGVLTWLVGRRFLEERVAVLAGLLTWVAPGAYVWWSTKERGFYPMSVVLGLVLLLSAQRIVERDGRPLDWIALGLSAGLGFWTSPTVAYFAVPAGIWILARRAPLRWSPLSVPAAVLGALPWLWHNVEQGWASLEQPEQASDTGYLTGLGRLLWHVLPMALNLRWPIDGSWIVPVLAVAVYAGLGVALILRRPPLLLAVALLSFPFLYALFPGAGYVGEGRYGFFATPFLALAIAWLARHPVRMLAVVLAAVVLTVPAVDLIGAEWPEHVDADLAALEREGVDMAWADYWIAYRLDFLAGGDLVASPLLSRRDDAAFAAVAADPTPAFLYARTDERWQLLEAELDDLGVTSRLVRTEHFVAVLAEGPVAPTAVTPGLIP